MKPKHLALIALLTIAACALAACRNDDDVPTATPTIEVTPTPTTPTATTTPSPTPTSTPEPGAITAQAWIVDATTGKALLLHEAARPLYYADFDAETGLADIRWLTVSGGEAALFALDGSRQEPLPAERCRMQGDDAVIDDETFEDTSCGTFSPDGTRMIYSVPAGTYTHPSGYTVPVDDYWILQLDSGERRLLQGGLIHCGGCDGMFGPTWSPSGRFVIFPETGGDGRVWLADLDRRTSEVLTHGRDVGNQPQWSPVDDVVVLQDSGQAVLLDPVTSSTQPLPASWPVAWDTTGAFLYSPGWEYEDVTTTTIMTAAGEHVGDLSGVTPWLHLWDERPTLTARGDSFVAALERASGCAGVAVYRDADLATCIEGGVGAAVSPDGSRIAIPVVREQGIFFTMEGGYGSVGGVSYDIAIFDTESQTLEVVLHDLISWDTMSPPGLRWSDDSHHLLIRTPASYGL